MTAQEEDAPVRGTTLFRRSVTERRIGDRRAPHYFFLEKYSKLTLPKRRAMHPCGEGIAFAFGDRSDPMQHEGREQHGRATRAI